jgi:hypothetical protein
MRRTLFLALACLSLLTSPLAADGLAELKAKLTTLQGGDAIRATLDHQSWSQSVEDKKPKVTQGRVNAQVEDGPQGLRMSLSRGLINQATQERRAQNADPEKTSPIRSALQGVDPLEIADLLNHAETLIQELNSAQLLEETPDGKGGRILKLKLTPKMSESERKHIKKQEVTVTLTLNAEGLPIASESSISMKGSFFLISFEMSEKRRTTYSRIGNRLVATRLEKENSSSGAGQSGQGKTVTTLAVN